MQDLALKYPSQAKQIGEALGIKDAQHAAQVNRAVGDLTLAGSIGTDQAMAGAISKHRDLLSTLNTTPQEMFQMWKENPAQFKSVVGAAGMSTVPYQKQQELAEQRYGNDTTRRGQDIGADTAAAGRTVQREGQVIQRDANAVKRESNELKQQETRQKMAQARSEQGTAAQGVVDAYITQKDTLDRNFTAVTNAVGALGKDGKIDTNTPEYKQFQNGFGLAGWASKGLPGSESANTWGKIKGMQADARQMGIAGLKGLGSASDADAAAAQNAFLNIDDKTDAATAKQATEKYIQVLQKYRQNLNDPAKVAQIRKARVTSWAANNNVNPPDVTAYFKALSEGHGDEVKAEWAQMYPGVPAPKPGDFN